MNEFEREIDRVLKKYKLTRSSTKAEFERQLRYAKAENHPDRHPENPRKYTVLFQEINEDYDFLLKNYFAKDDLNKKIEEANRFRKNFLDRLYELQDRYQEEEFSRLCGFYIRRVKKLSELEELKIQRREFEERFENLKRNFALVKAKRQFADELNRIKNSKLEIDSLFTHLADYFFQRLDQITTLNELEELKKEYNKSYSEVHDEVMKRRREKFEKEISTRHQEVIENRKNNLIDTIDYLLALEKAKRKKREFVISFLDNYRSKTLAMKDLEKLEQLINKFDDEYKRICKRAEDFVFEQKSLRKNFVVSRDKLKQFFLSKFCKAIKNSRIDNFLEYKDLLNKIIYILKKINLVNFNEFEELVLKTLENIDYNDYLNSKSQLEFLISVMDKKIEVKFDELKKVLQMKKENNQDNKNENLVGIKEEIYSLLINEYTKFISHYSLDDINNSLEILLKIFEKLNSMTEDVVLKKYHVFKKMHFETLEQIESELSNLDIENDFFISELDGKIYRLENIEEDLISIVSIDSQDEIIKISLEEFEKRYVSVREFFKNAKCVIGYEVSERRFRNFLKRNKYHEYPLFLIELPVFMYKKILLIHNGDSSRSNNVEPIKFEISETGWVVNGKSNFSAPDYYNKRSNAESIVMEEIFKKLDETKEKNERSI